MRPMKTISDSDYSLLIDKLPLLIASVRCSPYDSAVINAARRLKLLRRKLLRASESRRQSTPMQKNNRQIKNK